MKKEFLISTIISAVACAISFVAIIFALLPNKGVDGKDGINGVDGKDGVTPTIEISDDGFWVINGEKTDVPATEKSKKFVVGEEILFENGEEFTAFSSYYSNSNSERIYVPYTITSAKLVAVEKIPLDDPNKWGNDIRYLFSYKYRLYVTGYAPVESAGAKFNYTLLFRTDPYNGVNYMPEKNYESTTVGEDGYFEFSVDVYLPDIVTKVYPLSLEYKYKY